MRCRLLLLVQALFLFIAQQQGFSGTDKWRFIKFENNVSAFAIDASNPQTLYAASFFGGCFKSTDSGANWARLGGLDSYPYVGTIYALAVSPTNSNVIVAAGLADTFASRDGGQSWATHPWFQADVFTTHSSFQFDPIHPDTIYGIAMNGIGRSTDGGNTWYGISQGIPYSGYFSEFKVFAIDPQNTNILYAGGDSRGLWKTTNGGNSWTQKYKPGSYTYVESLAINPNNPQVQFLGTNRGLLKTTDKGNTWQQLVWNNASLGDTVAIDPIHTDTVYAGGLTMVSRSTDAGQSWIDIGGIVMLYAAPRKLVLDPKNPSIVYAATYKGLLVYGSPVSATSSLELTVQARGAASASTAGTGTIRTGYAEMIIGSSNYSDAAAYGTAVFSYRQDGAVVSEAGVPAVPATTSARIFIDYRSAVNAIPGHDDAGTVNINTGVALVNSDSETANVTYTLRDTDGKPLASGHGTIEGWHHMACFIDHLKTDAAPDFDLPSDFRSDTQFGSLDILADHPLSVLALRGTTTQRNEFLITTTPVADLTLPPWNSPIYFPQFVDGGGYTTSLILLNTSDLTETGTLQIIDKDGNPLSVNQVGGTADSSFKYSIQPGGFFRFQTDGFPAETKAGWVRLTPDAGTSTPIGSGVFGYNPDDVLVSESGIASATATTHARIYVDLSGNHDTGLAIANVSGSNSSITINAFQKDGVTVAGTSEGPIPLPIDGYKASFADQFVAGLPEGFTGVLDIASTNLFAALTLRSLMNERHEFLMTTFPIADANQAAPVPVFFPHIAEGGGYTAQFIFVNPGEEVSYLYRLYDETGMPMDIEFSD
jgi:photosystem II stability/assembly factor-like uncharacterized protein